MNLVFGKQNWHQRFDRWCQHIHKRRQDAIKRDRQAHVPLAAMRLLSTLALLSGGISVLSNILAVKVWGGELAGLPITFDAGLVIYPALYVVGDLIIEIYGRDTADRLVWCNAGLNVLAYLALFAANRLPAYGDTNIDFEALLGLSGPVVVGSVLGFLVSRLLDNYIFVALRRRHPRNYFVRAIASSVVARAVDTILFNTLAFGWRLDWTALGPHMLYAFIAATALEALLCRLVVMPLVPRLKRRVQFDNGKIITPKTVTAQN